MFIGFINFYQRFIKDFNRIAISLIFLIKTTGSSNLALKAFKSDDNKIVGVDGRTNRTVVNLFKNEKSRNLMHVLNIKATRKLIFFDCNTKKIFNYLQIAFIQALIF